MIDALFFNISKRKNRIQVVIYRNILRYFRLLQGKKFNLRNYENIGVNHILLMDQFIFNKNSTTIK